MKRKVFLVIILALVLSLLIFGVVYFLNPNIFSKDIIKEEPPQTQYIIYPVFEGEIEHTYEVDAQVISQSPEIYVENILIEGISNSNLKIHKEKGEYIEQDEKLYTFKNKAYDVNFNGIVLDIYYEEYENEKNAIISLLNYDKLFIVSHIDMDKIERINYDTPVKVLYDGEEYSSEILNIGYEIYDKKLPINISLPEKFYPGTPVNVKFILDTDEKGLYVLKDSIYQDGENYFANIKYEDTTKQVEIIVGQQFSVEENGDIVDYIEVLSGLTIDDKIYVEDIIRTPNESIKESLLNE